MIYSAFLYGHTITDMNQNFPFKEDGEEIVAILRRRTYTASEFADEIKRALNEKGSNDYDVVFDYENFKIKIISDGDFTLLTSSSQFNLISPFQMAGFKLDSDYEAELEDSDYVINGELRATEIFKPQFPLQDFVDFNDHQMASNASVNQSASGKVEVVRFGSIKLMKCNIRYQTNNKGSSKYNGPIKEDEFGVDNLRNFLLYATTKARLEFIYNIDKDINLNPPVKCILESTESNKDGVGFEMKEQYARGLVGYFDSGSLIFREVK